MEKKKEVSAVYAVPLVFVIAVVPLVALIAVYGTDIGENAWISGSAFYDFFLYYKSQLLMMFGLVSAVIVGMAFYKKCCINCQGSSCYAVFIPLVVFAVVSTCSALLSEHRRDAVFGGYEQFEGLLVLLAYFFCFLLTYLYATNREWINMLLHGLLVGSLIISMLGTLQTFGVDYMTQKWILPLLTMFLSDVPDGFQLRASFGSGVAYSTLYNPNYVGTYVALVLPISVFCAFKEEKIGYRIVAIVSSAFQIIMLFGAGSFTGMIGVVAATLMAVIFLFCHIRKKRKLLISLSAGIVMLFVVLLVFSIKTGIMQRFTESSISSCNYTVSSIETKKDRIVIVLDNGYMVTAKTKEKGETYLLQWLDEKGEEVQTKGNYKSGLTLCDNRCEGITLRGMKKELERQGEKNTYDILRLQVTDSVYWDMLLLDGEWYYINRIGKLDNLRKVETCGFEHQYDLATNRGYIWSRTLPLLKETIVLGKGADNFVYAFPNDDYVGKINCGFDAQTVTKPHNMYMQIWVQDGMPACLAFVVLYLVFAIRTFSNCLMKGAGMPERKLQIAVLCGATGYMVAGLANDATICVTPIFWVLLGLGLAVNEMALDRSAK